MLDITKDKDRTLVIPPQTSNLLKVLCCLIIALHHYSQQLHIIQPDCNPILRLFASQGGYIGVAFFFFLSGYGLIKSELKKHLSLIGFVTKRIRKVYIPTLIVTIVWLPTAVCFNICNLSNTGG